MKKNQVKVGNYVAPQIEIVSIETTCHMLDTSYPSQHNPATPRWDCGRGRRPRSKKRDDIRQWQVFILE